MRIITVPIALASLIFGVHQVSKPEQWRSYMPDLVERLLPLRPETGIRVHGSTNLLVGSLLLAKPNRLTAGTAGLWWLGVLPLCTRAEGWQTGVRDACIVAALLAVAYNDK